MRTLQEKYNAVLEGNFSKEQFRRDAVMQLPSMVSKFNSFEDMTTILKNRGMLAEAKKEEVTAYKKPEVDPADTIAPDLLDDGIKAELAAKKIEGTPTEEEYAKAKEAAVKKLIKDPLAYKNAQTMPKPGEKMEKKKLQEADSRNSYVVTQDMANLNTSDIIDKVSDEPVDMALAFKKMVMQNAEKYAVMSKEELLAAFDKFKEDYLTDQEAEYRSQGTAAKTFDDFEAGAFYEDKRVELKEAVKTLIKRVLSEDTINEATFADLKLDILKPEGGQGRGITGQNGIFRLELHYNKEGQVLGGNVTANTDMYTEYVLKNADEVYQVLDTAAKGGIQDIADSPLKLTKELIDSQIQPRIPKRRGDKELPMPIYSKVIDGEAPANENNTAI